MDYSPPGSSVHGILQVRIIEWVAIPFSRGSSQPRDRTQVSHIAGRFFTIWATREVHESIRQMWIYSQALSLTSYVTLDKVFNLAEPQFSHLQHKLIINSNDWWEGKNDMLYKVFIIVSMNKKSRMNSSCFCYCYFWLVGKANTLCVLTQVKVIRRKGKALSDQCEMWESLSGVHGTLQARILQWMAFPFSRGSSQPREQTQISHIAGRFSTRWATREA